MEPPCSRPDGGAAGGFVVCGARMAQGKALTDEQVEAIRMAYVAAGGRVRETARALGVAPETVRKYGPLPDDDFSRLRTEKKADIIAEMAAAQLAYLRHLASEATVKATAARDAVIVFGTLTDKLQLLTGQATERHEHRDVDGFRAALAGRIDELAERRRAKGADLVDDGAASG